MKSYEFIELFKEKKHLPSDYRAAKELGITRQSISLYKNGRPLDEDLALPIAEILDINPSEILFIIAAEKSRKPEAKKAWLKLSKLSKQTGTVNPMLLILLPFSIFLGRVFCILCKIGYKTKRHKSCLLYSF